MSILFEPIEINGMKIPNRIVRSATNDRCADGFGRVTDSLVRVYEALAAGGVGLIITGHAFVAPDGKASPTMLGIESDDSIPGLKRLVDAVHRYDSKIVIQINHAGRQTASATIGETPAAPSAVYNPITGETPRPLADEEIEALIQAYGAAAGRAVSAGFDGVQIHSAHGYLCSQFNSPYTNRRTDRWGGNRKNRMRFLIEVLGRIRSAVGDRYPVLVKLNSEDCVEGGLTVEESTRIAEVLCSGGIDAVEISGGIADAKGKWSITGISEEKDEAYFLANARIMREAITVPSILVGGLRSPSLMERLLEAGEADMVSLCRPFIREPDLAGKWRQGDRKKADCISCNGCQKYRDEPVRCILVD
jgi:2,4-dienoyl-CoA reductase-like NADH-dependent reductase (Old Yellow Enzyme family)